jgi:uncharacterized protein
MSTQRIVFLAKILFSLSLLLFAFPSLAFDCAKAYLPVDFVICSDPAIVQINAEHEKTWYDVRSHMNNAEKHTLLISQRKWLRAFPPTCGIPARGKRPTHITPREQHCVAKALQERIRFLRSYNTTKQETQITQKGQHATISQKQPVPVTNKTASPPSIRITL